MKPEGRTVVAPLPAGINGHFGPQLLRFVLAQYHQGQVTVPRLVTLLSAIGIEVSKRQVVRLLIDRQDRFLGEARDVLRAGLSAATWVKPRLLSGNGSSYVSGELAEWLAEYCSAVHIADRAAVSVRRSRGIARPTGNVSTRSQPIPSLSGRSVNAGVKVHHWPA